MRHAARGEVRHRARDVETHVQRARDTRKRFIKRRGTRLGSVSRGWARVAAPRAGAVQVRVQTPALHELLHDAQVGRRQARAEQAHHARVSQAGKHGDFALERAERAARRPRAETRRSKRLHGDARRRPRTLLPVRVGKAILRVVGRVGGVGGVGGVGAVDFRLSA